MKPRKSASGVRTVLAVMACCSAAVTVSAYVNPEPLSPSADSRSVTFSIPRCQTGLNLNWQARVGLSSGHFVLYWGPDESQLLVVSEVSAREGANQYNFYDLTAHAPFGQYRLVFRDSQGEETILAEAHVDVDESLESEGLGTTSTNPQPGSQHAELIMEPMQNAALVRSTPVSAAPGAGPAPPEPPP